MMSSSLLILGASSRAAAFSALAGGLSPVSIDLFADADLAARCPVSVARDYPAGLVAAARNATDGPWMYTGGLENRPDLVEQISAHRALYGNPGDVLRRVRDPWSVRHALVAAGLMVPDLQRAPHRLEFHGRWLRKPLRSSGGGGIGFWTSAAIEPRPQDDGHYFQQYIEGRACAAIYLAAARHARLVGTTEQILLANDDGSPGFRYAGSIGPLPADARRDQALAHLGQVLAEEFRLRGLFGVDFIDDGHDVWPVEVNPRYTASVEVLERSLGFSAVGEHVVACRDGQLPGAEALHRGTTRWQAKQILYADGDAMISDAFTADALAANRGATLPAVADIPRPGTTVKTGQPVMTIFAGAETREVAMDHLAERALFWRERLALCHTAPAVLS